MNSKVISIKKPLSTCRSNYIDVSEYPKRKEILDGVASFIIREKQKQPVPKKLFIGIEGFDASGKSSFIINELMPHLQLLGVHNVLVKGDWSMIDKSIREADDRLFMDYITWFDYDVLLPTWLNQLYAPGLVDITLNNLYNQATEKREAIERIIIDDNSIVIVDGLFLNLPSVRPFIDKTIYFSITEEESLNRQRKRDVVMMGRPLEKVEFMVQNIFLPWHRKYNYEQLPKERSSIMIDHNSFSKPYFIKYPK